VCLPVTFDCLESGGCVPGRKRRSRMKILRKVRATLCVMTAICLSKGPAALFEMAFGRRVSEGSLL